MLVVSEQAAPPVCMQENIVSGLTAWEFADGATAECAAAVLEDLRRMAVEGFNAFGHGGLEIGGVLYGVREGDRLSIQAAAELPCEHALGPGFALSDTDRRALGNLLQAPAGLQCVGWYRSHTRNGLDLDAGDRDLFEAVFAERRSAGLVLKPTRWGPSTAALYARRTDGEILSSSPGNVLIEPPGKSAGEAEEPVRVESPPAPAAALPPAWVDTLAWPDADAYAADAPAPRTRAWLWAGAVLLVAAAMFTLGYFDWLAPSRKLSLQVHATSPGQVRIEWNRDSLPVAKAEYGTLQIHDGEWEKTIPLDRSQLRSSSIDYVQKSSPMTVNLRVQPRGAAAVVEESVEFVGPMGPPASRADAVSATSGMAPLEAKVAKKSPVLMDRDLSAPANGLAPPAGSLAPKRKFDLPSHVLAAPAGRLVELPDAPPVPASSAIALPSFPETVRLPPPLLAPPNPSKSQPAARPFTGPRSGRLIWTGELARRGVVEIDGPHASMGSLSGSLSTGAAEYRVSPAGFTHDGFTVYTTDGAANGRSEQASKVNGWNTVHFVYDPVRAAELVVLEKPSRDNHFSRLVFRNDGRPCGVVVIDWTAAGESPKVTP